MKIVAEQLVVNANDGFAKDAFERKPLGEALRNLIIKTNESLVISLDARWGEGKTTFVKMWQSMLAEAGVPSLYVDAFKDDYASDAFLMLASHISGFAAEHTDAANTAAFKKKAAKLAVDVLSWSGKIGAKALTLGLVGDAEIAALADIKDDLSDSIGSAAEKLLLEKLGSSEQDAALVSSFQTTLSQLPAKLRSNEGNRLVIIVDELDRCRPTFAVELLERIKHLFSVPNVTFVLVMNKEQLEAALKAVYGVDLDAKTYLQKFITIEASLPKRSKKAGGACDLEVYCRRLYQMHEFDLGDSRDTLLTTVTILSQRFDLSLRDLERVFTNLAILYSTANVNSFAHPILVGFVCVMKTIEPTLIPRFISRRVTYAQLTKILEGRSHEVGEREAKTFTRLLSFVEFAVSTEEELAALSDDNLAKSHHDILWTSNSSREDIMPTLSRRLSMFNI